MLLKRRSKIQPCFALSRKLTVISSRCGVWYRDKCDILIRLKDPGGVRDRDIVCSVGSRKDEGLKRSSDAKRDETAQVETGHAKVYNDLGHLPDLVPWNRYELITSRMAVQVDGDHTAWFGLGIHLVKGNFNVVVDCGACANGEDTWKRASG